MYACNLRANPASRAAKTWLSDLRLCLSTCAGSHNQSESKDTRRKAWATIEDL